MRCQKCGEEVLGFRDELRILCDGSLSAKEIAIKTGKKLPVVISTIGKMRKDGVDLKIRPYLVSSSNDRAIQAFEMFLSGSTLDQIATAVGRGNDPNARISTTRVRQLLKIAGRRLSHPKRVNHPLHRAALKFYKGLECTDDEYAAYMALQ